MEIHQLRYFCAVARSGSFVRAAESENIAQPSLSQQIRKLEKEIGAPLFDRLGRSVRLTQHGEDLLPRARRILRELSEAKQSLSALDDPSKGRLVVGCIPTILPYLLAPRIPEFLEQNPRIELRIREEQTPLLLESLQAGEIDLAILALPIRNPDIICSELFREPLLAALPAGHPLAAQDSVALDSIRDERMLLLREGHCLRDDVLTVCRRSKVEFHRVFESDNLSSIFSLVAAGLGLSIVPDMAAEDARDCKLLPLRKQGVRRIGYARARGHNVGPLQKSFTRWLRTIRA